MKTSRKEMIEWTFQQIIEGLCQGVSLNRIATNIVDGIANMAIGNYMINKGMNG